MKLECSECGNDLVQIRELNELSVIPYEWYKDPDLFKKEIIMFCEKCNYFKKLSSIDKMKYKIANRIMGIKE